MFKKFLSKIIAAGLGLWLSTIFIKGVVIVPSQDSSFFGINLTTQWHFLIVLGIILGLLNFFVKPILDIITLPLRILTLGIFSFVINIAFIWIIDLMFKEFRAPLLYPLLLTTLIIWGMNTIISILLLKED